ncbi:sensor histidine kinase [Aquibacillus sediminis]|uniref:sensor histidine kinase n=1 Tax=Aquibacillus sediminis TaxID=2574734 RepID=UPI0011090DA4|nr:methyl-accepting chemotaxis protein [Aquibacillus sediminis]
MQESMEQKSSTLKKQFVTRLLIVLLVILSLLGAIQYIYLSGKIDSDVSVEAFKVSKSIEQGLTQTQEASTAIEHQLDLKLKLIAQHISDRLGDKPIEEITNEELKVLKEKFDIAGISLLDEQEDGDIVGVKSTASSDIGFNFKEVLGENSHGYRIMYDLLHGNELKVTYETYADENTFVLPTAPSGSHNETPTFFKYGYYVGDDKDYIINPYFEANEVYHFTQEVGPNAWIETVYESNENVEEIAVLDPQVFADPSLLEIKTELWEKVVYGEFGSETEKDEKTLVNLAENPKRTSYIEDVGDETYYKMFIPTEDGKVIYVGLDYNHLSAPLKNMALILLIFSVISLLALFILSTRFFGDIYKKIQVIISQIKNLESGDFSTQSKIEGKDELADLSHSTNRMTNTLNQVLKDTTKEAENIQNLSLALKTDADESVEKVYELSVELTSKAREDNYEILDFLDSLEEKLSSLPNKTDFEGILSEINRIKELSSNKSASATDITITLSDLLNSLQYQSDELSNISSEMFNNMYKFKL